MHLAPPIAGKVRAPNGLSLAEYTIEFHEKRSGWSSGKIRLDEDGVFFTDLLAEEGHKCLYEIVLLSPEAERLRTSPETVSYMVGGIVSVLPLSDSIGVAMADNRVDVFFSKGEPLSDDLRCRRTHRCAYSIPAGQEEIVFRIPLVEGDALRADRNRLIGKVEISPKEFKLNLPAESDVEITLAIDRSRLLTATAYVPFLEQTFKKVIKLEPAQPTLDELRQQLQEQRNRIQKIQTSALVVGGEGRTREFLIQIEREEVFEQTEALLQTAENDSECRLACEERLRDLTRQVDRAEDSLEWSVLVLKAQSTLAEAGKAVDKQGKVEDREVLLRLQDSLDEAIRSDQPMLVRARTEAITELYLNIRMRTVEFWVELFEELLEEELADKKNEPQVEGLIALGREAIEENDRDKLESAIRQLLAHLRLDSQDVFTRGYGGSTIRSGLRP